jgi:hypothetical protein
MQHFKMDFPVCRSIYCSCFSYKLQTAFPEQYSRSKMAPICWCLCLQYRAVPSPGATTQPSPCHTVELDSRLILSTMNLGGPHNNNSKITQQYKIFLGTRLSVVVKALCYKPEGPAFDTR